MTRKDKISENIRLNMARDPVQHSAFVELAKKEGLFDIKDLEQTLPKEECKPTSYARRRSKYGSDFSTELRQKDLLEDIPPEEFAECRYAITTESLNTTIKKGVVDLAAKFVNDLKGPAFPFRPFTEKGKQVWPDHCEIMDLERFKSEISQNPESLFQEFKLRSLGLIILYTEIRGLHDIAQCLDHNQTCFYNMLKEKSFSEQENLDNTLMTELLIRDKKIEVLNQQLIETNQVVADLMIRERHQSAQPSVNVGTPSTQYTERGTKIERSIKVDDPDQFFDEPENDKLDFDGWRLGIEARLRDNADWFPTADQQTNYIMRRLAGKASRETIPFLKPSNPERFKTAKGMLDHLEAQYGDPDRIKKAENEWEKLKMSDPESYGNKLNNISYLRFRNAFCRLAAELQKPRAIWKTAFERRISPTLQKALALQFLDDNIDFDTIANLAAKVNFTFASADAEIKANRESKKVLSAVANTDRSKSNHNANKRYVNKSTHSESVQLSNPSREQFSKALKEGLCLTCYKKGHKSIDCTENKSRRRNEEQRDERINNLYQKMFPSVESSMFLESNDAALNKVDCLDTKN